MKNKLKELRKEKRLTISELAEKSGVSRPTIYAIENEENYSTTTATLIKIANALDVQPSQIFLM